MPALFLAELLQVYASFFLWLFYFTYVDNFIIVHIAPQSVLWQGIDRQYELTIAAWVVQLLPAANCAQRKVSK